MDNITAIILAAGQGTRMKSKTSKVLHEVAGKPIIDYVVDVAGLAGAEHVVLVVGRDATELREHLGQAVEYVVQSEPLGTGHAVMAAMDAIGDASDVLVLYGDTPLVRAETLRALIVQHKSSAATVTLLTAEVSDPRGYGRILRSNGKVIAIVEDALASAEHKAIKEINSGICCFATGWLRENLPRLQKSSKGEYFLTDLIAIAAHQGELVTTLIVDDPTEAIGINDRLQLAQAESEIRWRIRRQLMLAGVTLVEPALVFIDADVEIARDTIIYPGTFVKGKSRIGEECVIGPNCYIVNSAIGDKCTVLASVIEDSIVDEQTSIGPFSHLRGGAHLAARVHVGNFAEIKNAFIGEGTRMHHFSYIGDATVGRNVNIAAGTITCNFDSETGQKNRTVIEDDVGLGSDTMLIAPVKVGKNAITGAGSVVTRDIPANSVAFGAPARVVRQTRKKES